MTASGSPLAPARSTASARAGLGCAIPFGLLFAAAGLAAFWFITLRPLLQMSASADWIETPCEIIASELKSSSDSDGTTYRVAIRYRYEFGGRSYEADRYNFTVGSTNVGVKGMRAAVRAHPPGRRTVCFVDPDEPDSAVLVRSVPGGVWFGVIALVFPVFGALFIYLAWHGARKERAGIGSPLANARAPAAPSTGLGRGNRSGPRALLTPDASDPVVPGEVVLKPVGGRILTFVGVGFFALFWNGIVGVGLGSLVSGGIQGIEWFVVLFLVPFVVIGLGMIAFTLHAFTRLFAPGVEARLDPSLLRLGARAPFRWRLSHRGVRKLSIHLVGREEATYQQGTSTTTDRSEFLRTLVFESSDPLGLTEGRAELPLPATAAAPSFAAKNNKLVYELAFAGDIPWRADLDDRFLLPVRVPSQSAHPSAVPQPVPHPGGGLTLWSVERFRPGDTLVCTLARDLTSAPMAGPLTLQLGWFTEGRGTRDAAIVWSQPVSPPAPGADLTFEIRLPDTPWSFAGALVSVAWRLELLDAKRAPLIGVPLVIAPVGELVALPALPKEPLSRKWKKFGFRVS